MIGVLLLLTALMSSAQGQSCTVADEATTCLLILQDRFQDPSICSELDSVRQDFMTCGNHFQGDCTSDTQYIDYESIRWSLDGIEATCAEYECLLLASNVLSGCATEQNDICARSRSDIETLLTTCVEEGVSGKPECQNHEAVINATEEAKKSDAMLMQLYDQHCQGGGAPPQSGLNQCNKLQLPNDDFFTYPMYCEKIQESLNCMKSKVSESSDNYFYGFLSHVLPSGCHLEWGDTTLAKMEGCNYKKASECYASIPDAAVSVVYEQYRFHVKRTADIQDICGSTADLEAAVACVKDNMEKCDEIPPDGTVAEEGIRLQQNFLHPMDVSFLPTMCEQACGSAAAQVSTMNACLADVNIDQVVFEKNCSQLEGINDCIKTSASSCPEVNRAWNSYVIEKGLNVVAGRCRLQLHRRMSEMEEKLLADRIKEECMADFGGGYDSKEKYCSAYQNHLDCIVRYAGGKNIGNINVRNQVIHLAFVNTHVDCELYFWDAEEDKLIADYSCGLHNYGLCFDTLTNALELESLGDKKHSLDVLNVLLNPELPALSGDFTKCNDVESVDTNAIIECVKTVVSNCDVPSPLTELDPWLPNIPAIDRFSDIICDKDCSSFDVRELGGKCGGKYDIEVCFKLDLDRYLKDKSKCNELESLEDCLQDKYADCDYAREDINKFLAEVCKPASEFCLGRLLELVDNDPTPTTQHAPGLIPQVWLLLALLLVKYIW